MKLSEFSKEILFGASLESKLLSFDAVEFDSFIGHEIPKSPGRSETLKFSSEQAKFPKSKSLKVDSNKARALHFFANHELLAIEMMAAALYCYPSNTEEDNQFKRGILKSLKDEQKHLKLYQLRMNELGLEFGELPLNDFFWRQMKFLKTPESFFALMSLTFEMANLDFCIQYKQVFEDHGDEKTANIMNIVLEDEVGHVSLGRHWLEQWKPRGKLWDYYKSLLPEQITPARAKGIVFSEIFRKKAGLEDDFISELKDYKNDFSITTRKSWSKK